MTVEIRELGLGSHFVFTGVGGVDGNIQKFLDKNSRIFNFQEVYTQHNASEPTAFQELYTLLTCTLNFHTVKLSTRLIQYSQNFRIYLWPYELKHNGSRSFWQDSFSLFWVNSRNSNHNVFYQSHKDHSLRLKGFLLKLENSKRSIYTAQHFLH